MMRRRVENVIGWIGLALYAVVVLPGLAMLFCMMAIYFMLWGALSGLSIATDWMIASVTAVVRAIVRSTRARL